LCRWLIGLFAVLNSLCASSECDVDILILLLLLMVVVAVV